ncbi:MAG: hypothetical protein E6Q95_01835 [Chitinophagaceae bacterium]|nr:MAG: hypothetical protein E6Q95_01835 [Chitinophagaceae bacterium]
MKLLYSFSIFILGVVLLASCTKKDYFIDSGKIDPKFNGDIVQYLQSKPAYFDSLVRVIEMAGYTSELKQPNTTFFAPADSSIRLAIRNANEKRSQIGKAHITSINQIDAAIWKKYLGRYIFKFNRSLNDFSQIDFSNVTSYGGQMYTALSGENLNIGVIYDDLVNSNPQAGTTVTIKYGGYRHLAISFLNSPYTPLNVGTWSRANISSANIQPTNGYVHLIRYSNHSFGFNDEFATDVALSNTF